MALTMGDELLTVTGDEAAMYLRRLGIIVDVVVQPIIIGPPEAEAAVVPTFLMVWGHRCLDKAMALRAVTIPERPIVDEVDGPEALPSLRADPKRS